MSLCASALRPRACSGLMYAAVPMMTPPRVTAGLVIVGEFEASDSPAIRPYLEAMPILHRDLSRAVPV